MSDCPQSPNERHCFHPAHGNGPCWHVGPCPQRCCWCGAPDNSHGPHAPLPFTFVPIMPKPAPFPWIGDPIGGGQTIPTTGMVYVRYAQPTDMPPMWKGEEPLYGIFTLGGQHARVDHDTRVGHGG